VISLGWLLAAGMQPQASSRNSAAAGSMHILAFEAWLEPPPNGRLLVTSQAVTTS
jgi:hypothetical protein